MPNRVPMLYTGKDTIVHRLDPRVKLSWLLFTVVFLFSTPPWWAMIPFALVGLLVAGVARFPLRWLAVIMAIQIPNLIGFIALPLLVSAFSGGGMSFTSDVQFGIRLALAWLGAVAIFTGLFSTMRIEEIVDGLRGLKVPYRATYAIGYAFRLLYTSLDDLFRVIDGMAYRGVDLRTRNPFKLVRRLPKVAIPAITTVARRANAMMAALRSRGFSVTGTNRPTLTLHPLGVADVAFVAFGFGAALVGLELRFDLLAAVL